MLSIYNRSVDSVGVSWMQSGEFADYNISVDDPSAVVTWSGSGGFVEEGRLSGECYYYNYNYYQYCY